MPTQIEKLEAFASHLLDDMILLREKFAMLEPMLFDPAVAGAWGKAKRARGFVTLKNALLFSCAQDIAKVAFDGDKRVPSVRNFVTALEDDSLRGEFRDRFAEWKLHSEEEDEGLADALRRLEIREEARRREQFDRLYSDMVDKWEALRDSQALKGFLTMRNKVSAHTEIRYDVDEYRRVDLGTLGLKWNDLRETIEVLQELVEAIGLIVRNASFAWTMLDEQLADASNAFWTEASPAGA